MFGCNSITSSCDNFCFLHAMVVCCMYFLLLQMIVAAKKCCLSGMAYFKLISAVLVSFCWCCDYSVLGLFMYCRCAVVILVICVVSGDVSLVFSILVLLCYTTHSSLRLRMSGFGTNELWRKFGCCIRCWTSNLRGG